MHRPGFFFCLQQFHRLGVMTGAETLGTDAAEVPSGGKTVDGTFEVTTTGGLAAAACSAWVTAGVTSCGGISACRAARPSWHSNKPIIRSAKPETMNPTTQK